MSTPYRLDARAYLLSVDARRIAAGVFHADGRIDPNECRVLRAMDTAIGAAKAAATAGSLCQAIERGVVTAAHLGRLVDAYTAAIDELD